MRPRRDEELRRLAVGGRPVVTVPAIGTLSRLAVAAGQDGSRRSTSGGFRSRARAGGRPQCAPRYALVQDCSARNATSTRPAPSGTLASTTVAPTRLLALTSPQAPRQCGSRNRNTCGPCDDDELPEISLELLRPEGTTQLVHPRTVAITKTSSALTRALHEWSTNVVSE